MTKQVFTILKKLGKDTNANSFLLKMVPCSQSISNKTTMYFLLIFQDDTYFVNKAVYATYLTFR